MSDEDVVERIKKMAWELYVANQEQGFEAPFRKAAEWVDREDDYIKSVWETGEDAPTE